MKRNGGAVLRFLWRKEMGQCFFVLAVNRNNAVFSDAVNEKIRAVLLVR